MSKTRTAAAELTKRANDAALTESEMVWARTLVDAAFAPYAVPAYEPELRMVLAVLRADLSRRQSTKGNARQKQRNEDLAFRRLAVAHFFKTLRGDLKKNPQSTRTAQTIIGKLEEHFENVSRKPLMTVRTVQTDIRFLQKNGNFGI